MEPDDQLATLLLLHRQVQGDPRSLSRLLRHFSSAGAVYELASPELLAQLGVSDRFIPIICAPATASQHRAVEASLRWLSHPRHQLLQVSDVNYPSRLREVFDPPPLLFADGDASLLASNQVAIVGSRKLTATGRKVARMLAADLCRAGVTVTSGLALGIDAAAHQGALESGGSTIAVLGSGCDCLYPPANRRLGERIRNEGGLIISEFPLGTKARNFHFPQRNRLVTGMSLGTVVVEAGLRSGSLISARLAMEQGREVFAVPGSVLSPVSQGCHKLLRDGAKLTETVEDILEELEGIVIPGSFAPDALALSPVQQRLLDLLSSDITNVDSLTESSGLGVAEVLSTLMELEIEGLIQAEAGGYTLSASGAKRLLTGNA